MNRFSLLSLAALVLLAPGCVSAGRNTRSGTVLGAAIGAGTGAIVGHQVGERGPGALIGAGIGAVAGGLIGNAIDRSEEDAAIRTERALRERPARLSLLDVIRLSQAGVSDRVIIAKIDESGAGFGLSAQEIIDLRRSGVSDPVIEHMLSRPYAGYADPEPERVRVRYYRTVYAYPPPPGFTVRARYRWCD